MGPKASLFETQGPLPDLLAPDDARKLIELARSPNSEDVDKLIEIGMTRGLRHPRFAVEAIEAELGQRFALETVALSQQSVKLAKLLLWVTALAAIAAVANVLAVVLS